ncbi:MAG: membrane protein [Gemmatimonadota bacterium]|nr:MAG: membrane protein [Gemmatimonadota bacterium]
MTPLAGALLGVPARQWTSLLPGLLAAVALGALGIGASQFVGARVLGLAKSPVSPVMVGILLGMLVRNLLGAPAFVRPGLRFAVTKVLRLGIILLGIRLSMFEVARLGLISIPVVVVCILFGILFSSLLNRWFALPARLGTLIGVGTAICGVSAIAATGPVIDAKEEETAYAIAVITVFGLLAMVAYPFLCPWLFDDPTSVGLFLGTAVHDTSQVNGAAIIYSDAHAAPRALDVAVVTKLVRNLFMIAIIPWMAVRYHKSQTASGERSRVALAKLFPLFVIGFVVMAAFRSLGDAGLASGGAFGLWSAEAWHQGCATVQRISGYCLVVALSAVGLSTDFRAMRSLSVKPFLVGLGTALAVGAVSFAAITVLNSWILR